MHHASMVAALALFGFFRVFGFVTGPWLSDREIHQIAGEPARVHAVLPPGGALKVGTWNIERGARFERVLVELQRLDADVVLLQEVDMFCGRSGRRNVAKDLADALDMNWVFAGEFQEIGERHRGSGALSGQAMLSRLPIEDPAVIRFRAQSLWRWHLNPVQPRRGGRIALRAESGGIVFYNLHLESVGDDRLRHRQLDEVLVSQSALDERTPVVIAGDFNNVPAIRSSMFGGLTAAAFADALGEGLERRQTSIRNDHPIDWIFARNLALGGGEVGVAHSASDHHPLVATLVLDEVRTRVLRAP